MHIVSKETDSQQVGISPQLEWDPAVKTICLLVMCTLRKHETGGDMKMVWEWISEGVLDFGLGLTHTITKLTCKVQITLTYVNSCSGIISFSVGLITHTPDAHDWSVIQRILNRLIYQQRKLMGPYITKFSNQMY